jgi:hypothetical protein
MEILFFLRVIECSNVESLINLKLAGWLAQFSIFYIIANPRRG